MEDRYFETMLLFGVQLLHIGADYLQEMYQWIQLRNSK